MIEDEHLEAVCSYVERGVTVSLACIMANVNEIEMERLFNIGASEWASRNDSRSRKAHGNDFALNVFLSIRKASVKPIVDAEIAVNSAARNDDVQSAKWILERKAAKEYGSLTDKAAISGGLVEYKELGS